MIATSNKTITYMCGDYLVDIVTTKEDYIAWIYKDSIGKKDLMFGCPKDQQSYFEFYEIVKANVTDYMDLYDKGVIL